MTIFFLLRYDAMTHAEKLTINALLNQDVDFFSPGEVTFMILLSRFMRFANFNRVESLRLQQLGEILLDEFPTIDYGCPVLFCGINVKPVTTLESSPAGGPGGLRPAYVGDGTILPSFGLHGAMINMTIIGSR